MAGAKNTGPRASHLRAAGATNVALKLPSPPPAPRADRRGAQPLRAVPQHARRVTRKGRRRCRWAASEGRVRLERRRATTRSAGRAGRESWE